MKSIILFAVLCVLINHVTSRPAPARIECGTNCGNGEEMHGSKKKTVDDRQALGYDGRVEIGGLPASAGGDVKYGKVKIQETENHVFVSDGFGAKHVDITSALLPDFD